MPTFKEDLHLGHSVPTIDTEDIEDGAITEKKMADGSVSTRTIQNGAVTEPKIANRAVAEPKLADWAVSTRTVRDKAISERKLADLAVSTRTIQDKSVTNSKIADSTISMGKLDNDVQTKIQQGTQRAWTPKGTFELGERYDLNDLVYSKEDNSSYISLKANNEGHVPSVEGEEGWWMKVLDGSYVNRAIEEMEAAIAQAIEDAQEDISELISDSQATINAAVSGANSAAQSANAAAANADTKMELIEQQVSHLIEYEVADVLDEDGEYSLIPVQNKVVTEALSEKQNTSEGTYIFCTKTSLNVSSPATKNFKNYGNGIDTWYPAGAPEYVCYYEVTAYDKIDVNNISDKTLNYFLTTKIGSSSGVRVAYAGEYKSIAVLPANDSRTIVIPNEEHVYLVFVQVANTVKNSITMNGYKYQSGNVSKTPSADVGVNDKTLDLEDEEIRLSVADLNDRVGERKIHEIDVYAYQQTNLPNGSSWSGFSSTSGHRSILIPLSENDNRLIKLCATNGKILYTFLTSNDVNTAPAYASGYSGLVTLSQGRKSIIGIPSDALYFCLKTRDHASGDLRRTYDAYFLSPGWETLDEKDYRWGIDAWEGKNVCVLGDSISAGVKTTKSFVSYLKDYFNLNISNYAIAGAMWTYVDNSSPEYVHKDILTQAQTALASGISFDAIIIYAGINDFLNSIQLGDWYTISTETVVIGQSSVTRQKRTLTTDKFQGSINTAMTYIKSNFPYAQVILVTPLHFGFVGIKNGTASASEMYANANGNYIDEFVKAIRDASDIWCCPLVDLYKDSGMSATINSHAQAYYNYVNEQTLQMTDILHPKKLGHFRMARIIRNKLLSLGCGKYNNADIDSQL